MNSIPNNSNFHQSITGYAFRALDPIFETKDGVKPEKVAISALLVVVGAVELVVRSIFVILAKVIHFFIPKEKTINFDHNIMDPLVTHVKLTYLHLFAAVDNLVNFHMSRDEKGLRFAETGVKLFAPIEPGLLGQFIDLHFDGVRERPCISKETASTIREKYIATKNWLLSTN